MPPEGQDLRLSPVAICQNEFVQSTWECEPQKLLWCSVAGTVFNIKASHTPRYLFAARDLLEVGSSLEDEVEATASGVAIDMILIPRSQEISVVAFWYSG